MAGEYSGYLEISDGAAIVKLGGKLPKDQEAPCQEVVNILMKRTESFNTLDLRGVYVHSALTYFGPIADCVTELRVDKAGNVAEQFSILPEFKNLKSLRLTHNYNDLVESGFDPKEAEKLLEILRACTQLEDLTITPHGRGFYQLSNGLIADARLKTINGVTLSEWNPWSELIDENDRYYYTTYSLADSFDLVCSTYEISSEKPPRIEGKILIANSIESGPLSFMDYLVNTVEFHRKNFATSLDECSAIIIVNCEYEHYDWYTDGTEAFSSIFSIKVIDTTNNIIYAPIEFKTVKPPDEKPWNYSAEDNDVKYYPRYDVGDLFSFLKVELILS